MNYFDGDRRKIIAVCSRVALDQLFMACSRCDIDACCCFLFVCVLFSLKEWW